MTPANATLPDDAERSLIRTATDRQLFVEAGAGTGKTSETVKRIVHLVSSGAATLDQIVAITFTEAAAGELRERVREALESSAGRLGNSESERLCRAAVASLDDAPIQTIHSFAQRILQLHPIEAGLPPVFEVMDGVGAAKEFRAHWRSFVLANLAGDNSSDSWQKVLECALALGIKTANLRDLALQLQARWDLIPAVLRTVESSEQPVVRPARLLELVSSALEGAESGPDPTDKLFRKLTDDIRPWFETLRTAVDGGDSFEVIAMLASAPKLASDKTGNAKNWRSAVLAETRSYLSEAAGELTAVLDPVGRWCLEGLIVVLGRHVMDGVEGRKSRGVLQFHDLLVLARDLLVGDERVRQAMRERFPYVLVDEFQDTDPLQCQIVSALTATDSDASRLFTVGDPKQSIYRFRNADLDQYRGLRANVDEPLRLTSNFRTLPAIVEWVNDAFRGFPRMGIQEEWADLTAARSSFDGATGSVQLVGGAVDGASSSEVRLLEAAEIAATITRAQGEGWKIDEGDSTRPARYSDVAVLMPARTSLTSIERAFRAAAIPYRVESRSLIWATQEVRDVMAILRCIDDPTDQVSLVAALRTPALACSDHDLLVWRSGGGTWDLMREIPDQLRESKVARAIDLLRTLQSKIMWTSVADLVVEVIDATELFVAAYGRTRQREAWHRLRFIIDAARIWVEDGGRTLSDFVEWAVIQGDENADAVESIVPESDDDAVRIMTIHASKGLEFPIVAVVGLGSQNRRTDSVRLLWDGNRPELRIGDQNRRLQTSGFDDLAAKDVAASEEEQARLLYVACTRARDHLVVGTHHKTAKIPNCLAARLQSAIQLFGPSDSTPDLFEGEAAERRSIKPPAARPATVEKRKRKLDSIIAAASVPESLSGTTVARLFAGDPPLPSKIAEEDLVPGVMPHAQWPLVQRLAFGRAVHAALESVDLSDPAQDLSQAVEGALRTEDIAHLRDEAMHCIRLAMVAPSVRSVVAGRHWREITVAAAAGSSTLVTDGIVDLVGDNGDGTLTVIDYKTDSIHGGDGVSSTQKREQLLDRYKWQLLTYASALQTATGMPVTAAMLVCIAPDMNEPEEIHVPHLERELMTFPDRLRDLVTAVN